MTTEEEFAARSPLHAALLDAEKRVVDLGEKNARLRAEAVEMADEIDSLTAKLENVVEEAEAQLKAWQKHHAGTNDDDKRLVLGVMLRILAAAKGE